MRPKTATRSTLVICALAIVLSSAAFGCETPWSPSGSGADATPSVEQAIYQLQAALGLADGIVSESSQPPLLAGSYVALRWVGGRADVDATTGRIRAILMDQKADRGTDEASDVTDADSGATASLSEGELDREARRILGLLGWDSAMLDAEYFTPRSARSVKYVQAGSVFEKTYIGHDPAGLPNDSLIQVGLNVADGSLHSFLYIAGPSDPPDLTDTITREQAAKTARDAAAKSALVTVSTTAPASTTTTTAKKGSTSSTAAAPTTTTLTGGVTSVVLTHIEHPAITGDKDLLVWVVKLAADPETGRKRATVYVDAVDNKALLVQPS